MNKSNGMESEQESATQLVHLVYGVHTKNRNAMIWLERQANELFRKKGAPHLEIFQLNNTEISKESFVNISAGVLHREFMDLISPTASWESSVDSSSNQGKGKSRSVPGWKVILLIFITTHLVGGCVIGQE